ISVHAARPPKRKGGAFFLVCGGRMEVGKETAIRLPKEATCDVECAMKMESLRTTLNKKRKQQRAVEGGTNEEGKGKSARHASIYPVSSPVEETRKAGSSSFPPSSGTNAGEGGAGGAKDSRAKKRFVWSEPLHQDFVAAVFDIGLKCASPKLLLDIMPVVDGLTSEHIKSHLQKYRLHRQRSREEFLKSYGYLTNLEATKNGGSAAAATKAASLVAANRGSSSACGPSLDKGGSKESANRTNGCNSTCCCHTLTSAEKSNASNSASTNIKDKEAKEENGRARAEVVAGAKCRRIEDGGSEGGGGASRGATGNTAGFGGRDKAPSKETETSNGNYPRAELLRTHLELLSKGLEMQVEFHNHLREMITSQKELQERMDEESPLDAQGRPGAWSPRSDLRGQGQWAGNRESNSAAVAVGGGVKGGGVGVSVRGDTAEGLDIRESISFDARQRSTRSEGRMATVVGGRGHAGAKTGAGIGTVAGTEAGSGTGAG
ncbi:unnamed protein product, partial [Discosporangium mesarthrocarpum]